jgi:hypothetical protein
MRYLAFYYKIGFVLHDNILQDNVSVQSTFKVNEAKLWLGVFVPWGFWDFFFSTSERMPLGAV